MNFYNCLNAYLNLLYGNTNVFLYRSFENKKHYESMKEFIKINNISLPFFENLKIENEYDFYKFSQINDINKINDILGIDCNKDIECFIESYINNYHVIFIHGHIDCEMNHKFINNNYIDSYKIDNVKLFHSNELINKEKLSFNGPFDYFMTALYQIDKWPGVLVFKGDRHIFIPTQTQSQLDQVFKMIKIDTVFDSSIDFNEDMYTIHLSDLHLGPKRKNKGLDVLEESLDYLVPRLKSNYNPHIVITGDIMNSPSRKNMFQATSFITRLKKKYKAKVNYVLGNHDVLLHGLNLGRRQRSKVVAYLLGSHITVSEKEKIIYIKINSTIQGNLARGKVGKEQLDQLSDELSTIENIEDYTLIALVHHHVLEIPKDAFLKTKWHEKMFIGRWIESSKVLLDAPELLVWLKSNNINCVLHGHRHLPFFNYKDGLYVVSGGSSCGGGAKERKSRYLSYNLLKYNCESQSMKYCFIFYDDTTKQERQRVKVHLFEEEFYEVS